jgi:dephospho-CoA kinase
MTQDRPEASRASLRKTPASVPVIGIVGGIGSGKSEVARRLQQAGAAVVDADQVGHEVLAEADVKQALRNRWGESVFKKNGEVSRSAVAAQVFGLSPQHGENRKFLESISHPRIERRLREQIGQWQRAGRVPAVALDAALLFETGWHALCDWILFVDAPAELRRQRALARGWSPEQFATRQAAQGALEGKRERADHVLDNSGDRDHLFAQIDRWWRQNVVPGPQAP